MERRAGLDGLRGIAVLLVVGTHCLNWPRGGHLGVDLFFLLSGFLITTLLLNERSTSGRVDLRRFYRRRAVRLLPALGLMLAAFLVISAAKGQDAVGTAALGALYIGNLVQAFGPTYGPLFNSGLDHLWSLAQEEQFYVLWPFALPLLVRAKRPVTWLGFLIVALVLYRAVLAVHGAPHHRLYNGPDTHLDGLIAGVAVAFLLFRWPEWRINPLVVAIATPVAVEAVMIRNPSAGWDAFGLPFAEAACAIVLLAALTLPTCDRALSIAPLVWFGRISYSLYLWHFMLLWAFGWHHGAVVAALSIAVAFASTHWVEEPLRRRHRERDRSPVPVLVPAA